jgi:uncharacterized membrane protein YfcA
MRVTGIHGCTAAAVAGAASATVGVAVGAELICALSEHCMRCCVQLFLLSLSGSMLKGKR